MMKKKWIVATVVLILSVWIQVSAFQDVPPLARQIKEKIEAAVQNYKENMVPEGAVQLCEVVLMARPTTSWPEGFVEEMDSARSAFREADFLKGVGHINRALTIFKSDDDTSDKEETGQVAGIAQLVLNKIESAIKNFRAGDADQAVLLILESLALLGPGR